MRKDFIFIGLLLMISAVYSYFKGYIENGIGLVMTITGAYVTATGLFEKEGEPSAKKKELSYKQPSKR